MNVSMDYDLISILFAPQSFFNNVAETFNFIIQSPNGELISYGINLTYPGGTLVSTGSNAIGGQLTGLVNITGAGIYDTVEFNYYYETTTAGRREFTAYLPIDGGMGNNTFMANRQTTYGLGLFERVLIGTCIVIFVVGIATLIGQPLAGLGLGIFVYGFLIYIGFIPLWSVIISMIVGGVFPYLEIWKLKWQIQH